MKVVEISIDELSPGVRVACFGTTSAKRKIRLRPLLDLGFVLAKLRCITKVTSTTSQGVENTPFPCLDSTELIHNEQRSKEGCLLITLKSLRNFVPCSDL